jgi:GxxExxY protein
MAKLQSSKGYSFESLSYAVIGACIDVQRQLGPHCKEDDYQRALAIALEKRGIRFEREAEIPVAYEGVEITQRRVDFRIWDDQVEMLLEVKATKMFQPKDMKQSLLYMECGKYQLCLLVNFGMMPLGIRRLVNTPGGKARQIKEDVVRYFP